MDVQDFAKAYAQAAETRFPGVQVTIEAATTEAGTKVRWTMPSGLQVHQFLGNAYTAYKNSPGDLRTIIAAHLDAAPTGEEPDAQTRRANILPLVKTRMWLSTSMKQLDAAGMNNNSPFITEPLTEDLLTAYVEDRPDAMNYLAPAELDKLGIPAHELMPLALENLGRLLPSITVEGQDGRYGIRLDGNYDASMVFLAQAWRDKVRIDGEPVVALPARDELLVCGSNDAASVQSLRNMSAQIMAQSPYGLSALLYTWRDGKLEVYEG